MKTYIISFLTFFGVFANSLNIKPNNIINQGLYLPQGNINSQTSLLNWNFTSNLQDFNIYSNLVIPNIGSTNYVNIWSYGNSTDRYELDLYYYTNFFTIYFMFNQDRLLLGSYNINQESSMYQKLEILCVFENNTIAIEINNSPITIYINTILPVPLFQISNANFYIENKVLLNWPNSETIYNKFQISDTTNNLISDFDFTSGSLVDKITGKALILNNPEIKLISTTYDTLQFTDNSLFSKANFGITSIGFILNSLQWINATLNIGNQNFNCDSLNYNTSNPYLIQTFNCPIKFNTLGTFDLYISTDTENSYYKLQIFNVYSYNDTLEAGIISVQEDFLNNSTNSNLTLTLVLIGLAISVFIVLGIIIIMKLTKSERIRDRLIKLDLLYITLKHKDLEIKENSRHQYLGKGSSFYIRSSVVGGLLTIFLIILSIFICIAYLTDTYNNNTIITSYLGSSNGNKITTGHITATLTFKNVFYGTCDNWNINSNNLLNGITSLSHITTSEITSDCTLTWSCENCQTIVGSDSLITFSTSQYNIGFRFLEYSISINSYNGDNSITGSIIPNSNELLNSGNLISVIANPTLYTDTNTNKNGYTLDLEEITTGNIVMFSNFNNSSPIFNTIEAQIKLSRASNWLFISQTQKNTSFTIFFQLISILVSLFSLSKIALNLITKKRILKCILLLINCGKPKFDKSEIKKPNISPAKKTSVADEVSVSMNVL